MASIVVFFFVCWKTVILILRSIFLNPSLRKQITTSRLITKYLTLYFISEYHFRGARVIKRVIDNLIADGMKFATHVLLTGTRYGFQITYRLQHKHKEMFLNASKCFIPCYFSAGGVGVMFHIDNIARQLRNVGSKAEVRGISDSGWYVETAGMAADKGSLQYWQVRTGSRHFSVRIISRYL